MSLNRIFKDDTAIIEASIFEDDSETDPESPTDVTWEFNKPDGTSLIVAPASVPATPEIGDRVVLNAAGSVGAFGPFNQWQTIEWDGAAWVAEGVAGASILEGNDATFVLPAAGNYLPGLYRGRARFTLPDSTIRSTPLEFESVDLMAAPAAVGTMEHIVDRAWMKLEDCFDSELGGPWLRDKTMAIFDREKMEFLVPDAIYYINNEYQPATNYTEESFPFTNHHPLLTQALLVESIYHLIRSYVEVPQPAGAGAISYLDRRDYMTRWLQILQIEEPKLLKMLDLFKRDLLGFGQSAILVGGYSSGLRSPRFLRTRYPKVFPFGGYWR